MDVESQSQVSDIEKPSQISAPITDKPTVTTVLRVGQYILSTATLILVACAIDRNVLSPGVSSEEIVACASVSLNSELVRSPSVRTHINVRSVCYSSSSHPLLLLEPQPEPEPEFKTYHHHS
jgi:hypothetical protein